MPRRPRTSRELEKLQMEIRAQTFHIGVTWMEYLDLHANRGYRPFWQSPVYNQEDREKIMRYITLKGELGKAVAAVAESEDPADMYEMVELAHSYCREREIELKGFIAQIEENLPPAPGRKAFHDRLAGRRYSPPWHQASWWFMHPGSILHGIRPSEEHEGQISYYPTAEKFVRGISVAVRPGRYLAKYFGKGTPTGLSESQVREWAAIFTNTVKGKKLHMTDAPTMENKDAVAAEWVRVYKDGPGSCMKGMDAVHVFAYPGNTLRLAFFTMNDLIDSVPVTRCIVRDDKKQWLRIYPDDQGTLWMDMRNKLEMLGYERGCLDGVKLRLVKKNSDIVCPYIDEGYGGSQTVRVHARHLECGGGEHEACNTSGYLNLAEHGHMCRDCEAELDEDDAMYYDDYGPYCPDCYSNRYVEAHYLDGSGRERLDDWPKESCVYCKTDGEWYLMESASHYGVFQCSSTGRWYHESEMLKVNGQMYNTAYACELSIPHKGEKFALNRDAAMTYDNRLIHREAAIAVRWHDDIVYTLHVDDKPEDILPSIERLQKMGIKVKPNFQFTTYARRGELL